MLKRWHRIAIAALATLYPWPVCAQSQGPTRPQNEAEQHVEDLLALADRALDRAEAAATSCDAASLEAAIRDLRRLEKQSEEIAQAAHTAGDLSAVRPKVADSAHSAIANYVATASNLKPKCTEPTPHLQTPGAQPPSTPGLPTSAVPPFGTGPFTPPLSTTPTAPVYLLTPADRAFMSSSREEAQHLYSDYVDAALHCDSKRMENVLVLLNALLKQVGQFVDKSHAVGNFGRRKMTDEEAAYNYVEIEIIMTSYVKMKCPEISQPAQSPPPSCPATTGGQSQTPSTSVPGWTGWNSKPDDSGNPFQNLTLDFQNGLRSEVGMPPLHWNPTLAAHALAYANILSQTGQLEHSSRQGRENERENIVVGRHGASSPLAMLQIWGGELQYFRPGKFPDSCDGDWSRCGHITQIVWGQTTDVGCGFATGPYDALVCRYSPPGNADGKYVLAPPDGWPCQPAAIPASAGRKGERGE